MAKLSALRSFLPGRFLREFRRYRYAHLIKRGRFRSNEKEFVLLSKFIHKGDNVIDVGANVGHYTIRMSTLVGSQGRVFAFEPISMTFAMLAENVVSAGAGNATLVNTAIHSSYEELRFNIPQNNPYLATICEGGAIRAFGTPIDSVIGPDTKVSFIKIDAEGHDALIIRHAMPLINRTRPIIMAELQPTEVSELVSDLHGYFVGYVPGSHNSFLLPVERKHQLAAALVILDAHE